MKKILYPAAIAYPAIMAVCATIIIISCCNLDRIATLVKWQSDLILVINWLCMFTFSPILVIYGFYMIEEIPDKIAPLSLVGICIVFWTIAIFMMLNAEYMMPFDGILLFGGLLFLVLGGASLIRAITIKK